MPQTKLPNFKHSNFWANLFKTPASRNDMETVLHTMPPFKDLSRKDIQTFSEIIHFRDYAEVELIFAQGDPGVGMYIVYSGEVIIEKKHDDGNKYILAKFQKGDFFGELAMLDEDTRSASAISIKESKVAVIFKPDLDSYIEKYPQKGIKILRGMLVIIASRLKSLNQDFVSLYLNTTKNKDQEVSNEP
jgi:CRP-like cAMP-binding protein